MLSLNAIQQHLQTVQLYDTCRELASSIPGFLKDAEGFALMLLAAYGPGEGAVVEIGSFKGRSTAFLALGQKTSGRGKVVAIDHFQGSPEHQPGAQVEVAEIAESGTTFPTFIENLRQCDLLGYVRPMQMASAEAAKDWHTPIRLLFIDGDHSFESSEADFRAFETHVVAGGLICFHDIGAWPGVTRFLQELLRSDPRFKLAFQVRSLAVVAKAD